MNTYFVTLKVAPGENMVKTLKFASKLLGFVPGAKPKLIIKIRFFRNGSGI